MGYDATRKLPGQDHHRPRRELVKVTKEPQPLVDALQKKAG